MKRTLSLCLVWLLVTGYLSVAAAQTKVKKPKAVFVILDGIPADVIEKLNPETLAEIAREGGYTRAHVGGRKGEYNETPTISAPGYISLLTSTWGNKHNVWDNEIDAPNYSYWNIFRIAEVVHPPLQTAVFSTWLDNRTKLIGEGLAQAGSIKLDYTFDGLEYDTVRYPHEKDASHIRDIDEAVAEEAAKHIKNFGPDLSWVYLEFTDDMGHHFGDSPQFYEAIKNADAQVKKIWKSIKAREKIFDEDWLLIITTDHGRDVNGGKNHGGQSDRERITWITTNSKNLNERFKHNPGIVDILPSICNHLKLSIPEHVRQEIDGVPFIGALDLTDLRAEKKGNVIILQWKNFNSKKNNAEIFVSETNTFKEGGTDDYKKIGEASLALETYQFTINSNSTFLKILLKTPHHFANVWIVNK